MDYFSSVDYSVHSSRDFSELEANHVDVRKFTITVTQEITVYS